MHGAERRHAEMDGVASGLRARTAGSVISTVEPPSFWPAGERALEVAAMKKHAASTGHDIAVSLLPIPLVDASRLICAGLGLPASIEATHMAQT